jgi:hypothetical protein
MVWHKPQQVPPGAKVLCLCRVESSQLNTGGAGMGTVLH